MRGWLVENKTCPCPFLPVHGRLVVFVSHRPATPFCRAAALSPLLQPRKPRFPNPSARSARSRQDGVGASVEAFHKHLPLDDMLCDVSLFLPSEPTTQVAEVYHANGHLKVPSGASVAQTNACADAAIHCRPACLTGEMLG